MGSWRDMGSAQQRAMTTWALYGLRDRMELGNQRYNSKELGFQGDPLDHAIEEWLDMGVYLFYAKRQRNEVQDVPA